MLVMACFLAPAAWAAPSPWTEAPTYSEKVKGKLDYGFKNFLGGWTELFTEPKASWDGDKNMAEGLFRGIWHTIAYTGGGGLHVLTAVIPAIDVPLPEGGVSFE